MIIRKTPKNKNEYIIVNSDKSRILQENGFCPKYIDNEAIYYVKSDKIIKFIKTNNILAEQ